jgi:hypothetical protein
MSLSSGGTYSVEPSPDPVSYTERERAQMKTVIEFSLRNFVLNKRQAMDNVQTVSCMELIWMLIGFIEH